MKRVPRARRLSFRLESLESRLLLSGEVADWSGTTSITGDWVVPQYVRDEPAELGDLSPALGEGDDVGMWPLASPSASNSVFLKLRDGGDSGALSTLLNRFSAYVSGGFADGSKVVTIGQGIAVESVVSAWNLEPEVEYAEANQAVSNFATPTEGRYVNGKMWGMYGDATTPSNPFGSQAGEAWAANFIGSREVYVAVIDEGIQIKHSDLDANIWTNPFDSADGVDNDGNGYVDDVNGWDFANNDKRVYDGGSGSSVDSHGTHVAGTIGAESNGTGVVGVNWRVTIIPCKFLNPGGGTTADAVEALDYLVDLKQRHGLNIVAANNSWGGGGFSSTLQAAITRASNAGILFVAAAGNSGTNNDISAFYPANYNVPNVISVAAINSGGNLASFSNYGATKVDIGAPGAGIFSTVPNNLYASFSGTSMAAPHVTGAAALYAAANPGASMIEIRDAILSSAEPTASLAGKTVTGGRLNVSRMLGL